MCFKTIIFSVLSTVLFYSCQSQDIDYINPVTSNKLAVYCFFNPDSIWTVQVSKLGSVMSSESVDLSIDNAIVELYADNQIVDTLEFQTKGKYLSPKKLKPEYNRKYHLEVKCKGFESVKSTDETLPSPIRIVKTAFYDYLKEGIFPAENYTMDQWYKQQTIETTIEATKGQYLFIKSVVTLSNQSKSNFFEYNVWDSSLFETLHSGELFLQTAASSDCSELSICTISSNHLLYEISYAEYEAVVSMTKMLTPNNIYSNIRGGTGIFAGYTLNKVYLK
jgi:hypothetical protein